MEAVDTSKDKEYRVGLKAEELVENLHKESVKPSDLSPRLQSPRMRPLLEYGGVKPEDLRVTKDKKESFH